MEIQLEWSQHNEKLFILFFIFLKSLIVVILNFVWQSHPIFSFASVIVYVLYMCVYIYAWSYKSFKFLYSLIYSSLSSMASGFSIML